jgi:hypothetical protein
VRGEDERRAEGLNRSIWSVDNECMYNISFKDSLVMVHYRIEWIGLDLLYTIDEQM